MVGAPGIVFQEGRGQFGLVLQFLHYLAQAVGRHAPGVCAGQHPVAFRLRQARPEFLFELDLLELHQGPAQRPEKRAQLSSHPLQQRLHPGGRKLAPTIGLHGHPLRQAHRHFDHHRPRRGSRRRLCGRQRRQDALQGPHQVSRQALHALAEELLQSGCLAIGLGLPGGKAQVRQQAHEAHHVLFQQPDVGALPVERSGVRRGTGGNQPQQLGRALQPLLQSGKFRPRHLGWALIVSWHEPPAGDQAPVLPALSNPRPRGPSNRRMVT